MESNTELKLQDCPFCGTKQIEGRLIFREIDYNEHAIECLNCDAVMKGSTKEEATEWWNMRVPHFKVYLETLVDCFKLACPYRNLFGGCCDVRGSYTPYCDKVKECQRVEAYKKVLKEKLLNE